MGKTYISKRLQNQKSRLESSKTTNSIKNTVRTVVEDLTIIGTRPITTTAKKLKLSRAQLVKESTIADDLASNDDSFNNVNIIVGIETILNLVNKMSCPSCHCIGNMSQKVAQRRGLLYYIKFSCLSCSFETAFTNSSQLVHSSTSRMDELNMMACAAANVVGIKRTGMTTILGMLNILPPVQIENWNRYQKIYSSALDVVKDDSLRRAGKICAFFFSQFVSHLLFSCNDICS